MSLSVDFDSLEDLKTSYEFLSQGGKTLMPLDNYGFSQSYSWVLDRFGVSWQLNLPT